VLLRIPSEIDFPKVRTFLESVARGSIKSKCSYGMGLKHFQCFLGSNGNNNNYYQNYYNIETILLALQSNTVNAYELLDSFVSYLVHLPRQPPIAPTSIALYVYAVRSYLQYYDIDINPSKFRRRVRLPKVPREDERPIDASEIRKILLACNNRRLKAYILVLASGGALEVKDRLARLCGVRHLDASLPANIEGSSEFGKVVLSVLF
jgi:site-specific recombinase XerC